MRQTQDAFPRVAEATRGVSGCQARMKTVISFASAASRPTTRGNPHRTGPRSSTASRWTGGPCGTAWWTLWHGM